MTGNVVMVWCGVPILRAQVLGQDLGKLELGRAVRYGEVRIRLKS